MIMGGGGGEGRNWDSALGKMRKGQSFIQYFWLVGGNFCFLEIRGNALLPIVSMFLPLKSRGGGI